jgi:hypothetical protein
MKCNAVLGLSFQLQFGLKFQIQMSCFDDPYPFGTTGVGQEVVLPASSRCTIFSTAKEHRYED